MGFGMIIHDDKGEFVACRSIVTPGVFRVDEGEAMGMLEALSWVKQLGFEKIIIEIDAKIVYDVLFLNIAATLVFHEFICLVRENYHCPLFFRLAWLHEWPMSRLIVLLEPLGLFLVLMFGLNLRHLWRASLRVRVVAE
ncbi:hypothetical protein ACS0TY_030102 [Phlomoides rotata]